MVRKVWIGVAWTLGCVSGLVAAPEPEGDVVAWVAEEAVTLGELVEQAAGELAGLERQRHEILQRHLEVLVADRLLAAAANRAGVTREELLARRVEAGLTPVTDEEIAAWYEARKARIPQPLASVSDQIRQHLETERHSARMTELLVELREASAVRLVLEPYRVDFAALEGPARGPSEAPVEVVVFTDFQCPYCRRAVPELERLVDRFGPRIRLEMAQLPLESIHPQARAAARAALCADRQERFWPMHDAIFERQGDLARLDYSALAGEIGLSHEAYQACLESDWVGQRLDEDLRLARDLGITSTPSVFVNGRPVRLQAGEPVADQIGQVVEEELGSQSEADGLG